MDTLFETEKKKMSVEDRANLSAELARADRELIEVKAEKGNVSRAYRVRIRTIEERVDTLSKQLDEGVMVARFEIVEIQDDARMMVEVQRKDTGQRVTMRQMTEVEKEAARKRKQREMFDAQGKPLTGKVGDLAAHAAKKKKGKGADKLNGKASKAAKANFTDSDGEPA